MSYSHLLRGKSVSQRGENVKMNSQGPHSAANEDIEKNRPERVKKRKMKERELGRRRRGVADKLIETKIPEILHVSGVTPV